MHLVAAMSGARTEPRIVEKPWGFEKLWAHTDKYVGKIIHINRGQRLSLQYHCQKEETILVLSGTMHFVYENETIVVRPGEVVHVAPGKKHRMCAVDEDVEVVEVSTPELDDVVRLSDDYGR